MYVLEFYNWDLAQRYYIESKEPITEIEFKEKLLKIFNKCKIGKKINIKLEE